MFLGRELKAERFLVSVKGESFVLGRSPLAISVHMESSGPSRQGSIDSLLMPPSINSGVESTYRIWTKVEQSEDNGMYLLTGLAKLRG